MHNFLNLEQIYSHIQSFNRGYHADFRDVRRLARKWLESDDAPSPQETKNLAIALSRALCNWGAGKRKAPIVSDEDVVAATLLNLRPALAAWSQLDLARLSIGTDRRSERGHLVEGKYRPDLMEQIEDALFTLMVGLNDLFEANNSVTYPTKALLLLTGQYVGLDSNVRRALAQQGEPGFSETQFPMPVERRDRSAKRLYRVLWLMGNWLNEHAESWQGAVRKEPTWHGLHELASAGRVVDIVWFQQGSGADRP